MEGHSRASQTWGGRASGHASLRRGVGWDAASKASSPSRAAPIWAMQRPWTCNAKYTDITFPEICHVRQTNAKPLKHFPLTQFFLTPMIPPLPWFSCNRLHEDPEEKGPSWTPCKLTTTQCLYSLGRSHLSDRYCTAEGTWLCMLLLHKALECPDWRHTCFSLLVFWNPYKPASCVPLQLGGFCVAGSKFATENLYLDLISTLSFKCGFLECSSYLIYCGFISVVCLQYLEGLDANFEMHQCWAHLQFDICWRSRCWFVNGGLANKSLIADRWLSDRAVAPKLWVMTHQWVTSGLGNFPADTAGFQHTLLPRHAL